MEWNSEPRQTIMQFAQFSRNKIWHLNGTRPLGLLLTIDTVNRANMLVREHTCAHTHSLMSITIGVNKDSFWSFCTNKKRKDCDRIAKDSLDLTYMHYVALQKSVSQHHAATACRNAEETNCSLQVVSPRCVQ